MNLLELLTKHKKEQQIQNLLQLLGDKYKISHHKDFYYQNYKSLGISLLFNTDDYLKQVFLYNKGHDDYERYFGQLPHGISFDMTKKEVEEKLGIPEISESGSSKTLGSWSYYPEFWMMVNYQPHEDGKEMQSSMTYIDLSMPPPGWQKEAYFINNEHEVVLRIETDLPPDIVTSMLGLQPSTTAWAGETYSGEQKVRKHNYWEYRLEIRKSTSVIPQVSILLDLLEPVADKVSQVAEGTNSRITISSYHYWRDKDNSMKLSNQQLRRIVGMGLGVEYFFYTV